MRCFDEYALPLFHALVLVDSSEASINMARVLLWEQNVVERVSSRHSAQICVAFTLFRFLFGASATNRPMGYLNNIFCEVAMMYILSVIVPNGAPAKTRGNTLNM